MNSKITENKVSGLFKPDEVTSTYIKMMETSKVKPKIGQFYTSVVDGTHMVVRKIDNGTVILGTHNDNSDRTAQRVFKVKTNDFHKFFK